SNSILLALMASGFDGNRFTFHGYFPIKEKEIQQTVHRILPDIRKGYAQIFIETPYRNVKTMESLLRILPGDIALSVSSGIGSQEGRSVTRLVKEWKKIDARYLDKVPAVFLLGNSR